MVSTFKLGAETHDTVSYRTYISQLTPGGGGGLKRAITPTIIGGFYPKLNLRVIEHNYRVYF